jgi:hypothetical protein
MANPLQTMQVDVQGNDADFVMGIDAQSLTRLLSNM